MESGWLVGKEFGEDKEFNFYWLKHKYKAKLLAVFLISQWLLLTNKRNNSLLKERYHLLYCILKNHIN